MKILKNTDPKFNKIEEYFQADDEKLAIFISEMNYFVLTDLQTMIKYYCTSALFYVKKINNIFFFYLLNFNNL